MAKSVLITAPTDEPVDAAELMTHLRLDSTDEAGYLKQLARDAREAAEDETWSVLMAQTWDDYFDAFDDPLVLAKQPVSSITSVKYTDTDGDSQTVTASAYELGQVQGRGVVRLAYNQIWPSGVRGHADAVVVRYVAGYGTLAANVPHKIRKAIILHAAHYYEHREANAPLPGAFCDLLRAHTFKEFR